MDPKTSMHVRACPCVSQGNVITARVGREENLVTVISTGGLCNSSFKLAERRGGAGEESTDGQNEWLDKRKDKRTGGRGNGRGGRMEEGRYQNECRYTDKWQRK